MRWFEPQDAKSPAIPASLEVRGIIGCRAAGSTFDVVIPGRPFGHASAPRNGVDSFFRG